MRPERQARSALDQLLTLTLVFVGIGLVGEYLILGIRALLPLFVYLAVVLMAIKILLVRRSRRWF